MDTHADEPCDDANAASWPSASILMWGTFGSRSPEGRRYHRRTMAALLITVLSFFVLGAWDDRAVIGVDLALAPGAGAMLLAGLFMHVGTPTMVNPAWFLVLEPFRAVVLYRLARQR
jgi:hypothetical protein